MKSLKYKKSTEGEVKAVCSKYYFLLKECYKYEAGMGTSGKVFGIPMNQLTSFLQDVKLIDKDFSLSDADRFFITVNSNA